MSLTVGVPAALPRSGLFAAGTASTSKLPVSSGLAADAVLIVFTTPRGLASPAKMLSIEKSAWPVEPVRKAILPMLSDVLPEVGADIVEPDAAGVTSVVPT